MAIDTQAVAQQVLAAMRGALGNLGPNELAALKQESTRLAQCLADIELERAQGQLTDDQAKAAVAGQAAASKAVLEAELGIAQLTAKSVIQAGLAVLASVALGAAGLGWAAPIVQGVITNL
jgi:hypothetical protein